LRFETIALLMGGVPPIVGYPLWIAHPTGYVTPFTASNTRNGHNSRHRDSYGPSRAGLKAVFIFQQGRKGVNVTKQEYC